MQNQLKSFPYNVLYSFPFQTIQKALESYGIYDSKKLGFMLDRGPNLIKALENYEALFCFPHRINNVLKTVFFSIKNVSNSTKSINNCPNKSTISHSC